MRRSGTVAPPRASPMGLLDAESAFRVDPCQLSVSAQGSNPRSATATNNAASFTTPSLRITDAFRSESVCFDTPRRRAISPIPSPWLRSLSSSHSLAVKVSVPEGTDSSGVATFGPSRKSSACPNRAAIAASGDLPMITSYRDSRSPAKRRPHADAPAPSLSTQASRADHWWPLRAPRQNGGRTSIVGGDEPLDNALARVVAIRGIALTPVRRGAFGSGSGGCRCRQTQRRWLQSTRPARPL